MVSNLDLFLMATGLHNRVHIRSFYVLESYLAQHAPSLRSDTEFRIYTYTRTKANGFYLRVKHDTPRLFATEGMPA